VGESLLGFKIDLDIYFSPYISASHQKQVRLRHFAPAVFVH